MVLVERKMNPFVAHMVGDFILQNDWMALNKKRHPAACAVHAVVYLMPFLLSHLQWWQLVLIGLQNFLQKWICRYIFVPLYYYLTMISTRRFLGSETPSGVGTNSFSLP
jgi:hypothetical protein